MVEERVSTPPATPKRKALRWADARENLTGCIFVFPALLIIGMFGLFPIAFSTYVSMHKWRINPGDFNGFGNYVKALDSLAYVIFFFLSVLLVYFVVRAFLNLRKNAEERDDKPWIWALPGVVTTLGIIQFIRFFVLLLPEILGIPNKLRGQVKTQELFVQYLGEAWRNPEVQKALWLAIAVLLVSFGIAYLVQRYLYKETFVTENYTAFIQMFLMLSAGVVLAWFTFSEIQREYLEAFEAGETLDTWAQIITICAGMILLYISWLVWRSASHRDSFWSVALRIAAAAILAVGAWVLIGELPRVVEAGHEDWWEGLRVTIWYSVGTVPLQLGISLVLATLLFQDIKGKSAFRLIYFLPYITPAVATAAVFRTFFSSRPTAPINSLLHLFGAKAQLWLDEPSGIFKMLAGPESELTGWLAGPSLALFVIIIFNVWSYVGYDTVIFLAGLGGIPSDLYEAAAIDGANKWDQFRHITLPLLSPTTYFLTLLAVIGTFKAFNHVWVLRSGAALGTTDTASIAIFVEFNRNTRYGFAAAMAFILLGVILILTIINNKVAEKRVFYG